MDNKKRQWRFVIGLIIALIVVIFAILNVNPVTISFGFTHIKLPLIVLIIVTLILGALITVLLANTGSKDKDDKKLSRSAKKELSNVKISGDNQIADALKKNETKNKQN
ncbi:lipopolysaccharide assembly protein LapA domain-containing protein [Companilactobacillus sp.]|uniref:LapA family protein n=1 Tax=Companilactobacillus sp. TaxID=2767905 RepID=UPI00261A35BF|nr:lipopolysaccharide assembly protein LapA domain-containing protein [Companilactobacillus sp.]